MSEKGNKITWAQFSAINDDTTSSFEDLCRLLFNMQFFEGSKNFVSKPNHPGIEVFPIFEEISGKRISFQSKFFSPSINYPDIEDSIKKTIKYHSDDLDVCYLYCNKDINIEAKGYKRCQELLHTEGIELELITNKAILDRVIVNPRLGEYFFGEHSLNKEWFDDRLNQSLDALGTRYNDLFNISTETERELNLFLENSETLRIIEEKKIEVIDELERLSRNLSGEYKSLISDIILKIKTYKIDSLSEIKECLLWREDLYNHFSEKFNDVSNIIKELSDVQTNTKNENNENKVYHLENLIRIPDLLGFNKLEKNLITKKKLIINGEAGTGKSQLLSKMAKNIIDDNGYAILVPGHVMLSSENIKNQILSYLDLNINFSEFLNVIETLGELNNRKVYIFIDAINESNNKEVWRIGLPIIFREIERLNFVKIVVSLRSGYENLVLSQNIKQEIAGYNVPKITHHGFQNNSIDAIREFLNYNNIPFSPSYFLQSEMTNPLFLTMFCKAYDGHDFDMYQILDRFLKNSDIEAQKNAGLQGDSKILNALITEIANFHLKNQTYIISQHELLDLEFWNRFGLVSNKLLYLSTLTKSGIFLSFMNDGEENYRFGYNLLEDFLYAKVIINKFSSADDCRIYLKNKLLRIDENKRINSRYIDTFIVCTSLFAVKFGEECIDIVDDCHDFDKHRIINSYVQSYSWRPAQSINKNYFRSFINKNRINAKIVFKVLIENSGKDKHPLNAEFLHDLLYDKSIYERDYLWTVYINGIDSEDDRLIQLIDYFNIGNKFNNFSNRSWLIILLFSWLLTSSNRIVRDKASKSMIELLKNNYLFCLPLLRTFESVNDPYVIQRLYAVVLGACTKTNQIKEDAFKELAEYIYRTIFDKPTVYPDILLRDYAKLIIEYFLFKFPNNKTIIDESKIKPPYNSERIPLIEGRKEEYRDGLLTIAHSMAPEGIDILYGDFGRYVFESALRYFSDVDSVNIYNYSMRFIENELGYKNKLFSNYDSLLNRNYNRHGTKKVERIGKKYQWITMYNILARVSDHHELSNKWNDENEKFEGAWNPYVRDFDPTLNDNFVNNPNQPNLIEKKIKVMDFIERNASIEEIDGWVYNEEDSFFSTSSEILFLDKTGDEWVALDYYNFIENTDDINEFLDSDKLGDQNKWVMAQGYFVKNDEFEQLKADLIDKNFMGRWFPEGSQNTYWLFNREFGWSTGYKELRKDAWLNYEVETGELQTVNSPDINIYIDDFDGGQAKVKYTEESIPIRKTLAKVMKASNNFLWEEEYDASQNEATTFGIPCGMLIDDLELEQQEYDGYYYNKNNELVVFYDRESEKYNSPHKLLIRKKDLDDFLKRNDLVMFWECLGEKTFEIEEMENKVWSEWSGLLTLTDKGLSGELKNVVAHKLTR
ncbi:NACHT domain-containing protein [Latilactobacillus sakei]|uniref:NACHT domain-containing protein n=1 Tax=Latilactobacillus sakei TaxID=1599 RepID=UPI000976E8A1|nr:hypothetical protein [Latilactobacillus sakei]